MTTDINSYTGPLSIWCPRCGHRQTIHRDTEIADTCPQCGYDAVSDGWDCDAPEQWRQLYQLAWDADATIQIGGHHGRVILVCSDGSQIAYEWSGARWEMADTLNTYPGDVAARR
jgi:hypothetical protein